MRRNTLLRVPLPLALAATVLAVCSVGVAHPDGISIPINFGADEPEGARSDVTGAAGVLGTETWNNLDLLSGVPQNVEMDDQGVASLTDVMVEWTSNNTWSSTGRGEENNTAPDGPDRNLMTGYLDTTDVSVTTVTVSELDSIVNAGDEYTVYVYMNGGVTGRGGDYAIDLETLSVVDNAPFDGIYNDGEDFVVFEGLTDSTFTLTATPTTGAPARAPINAIEVVSNEVSTVCPRSLHAEPDGANVTLTWQNGDTVPTSVRVVRDGTELAAAAPADPPTYTDTAPPPGILAYELTFDVAGEQCNTLTETYDACITDLAAAESEAGVVLTWTDHLTYGGIEIKRDGAVLEASLAGTEETYTDADPPGEVFVTYTAAPTNGTCDPATVIVDLNIVRNAGFEEPAYADGNYGVVTDWNAGYYDLLDPSTWILGGNGDDAGAWNPDAIDGFTDGAFEGENIGWVTSYIGYDVGLAQVLTTSLEANTKYVLSAQVGNSFYNGSDQTAPYRLELLAGGVLLEEDSDDSPIQDTWELHSLTYSSGPTPAQLGESLEIRLIAVTYTNGGGVDGYEVEFDDVTLSIEPEGDDGGFIRGDSNRDGAVNIADGVYILQNLFAQGPPILCPDAGDFNDDEGVNIADAIYILQNLFAQGPPIPPPNGTCGPDTTGHPQGGLDLPPCEYCPEACQSPPVACPPAVK